MCCLWDSSSSSQRAWRRGGLRRGGAGRCCRRCFVWYVGRRSDCFCALHIQLRLSGMFFLGSLLHSPLFFWAQGKPLFALLRCPSNAAPSRNLPLSSNLLMQLLFRNVHWRLWRNVAPRTHWHWSRAGGGGGVGSIRTRRRRWRYNCTLCMLRWLHNHTLSLLADLLQESLDLLGGGGVLRLQPVVDRRFV